MWLDAYHNRKSRQRTPTKTSKRTLNKPWSSWSKSSLIDRVRDKNKEDRAALVKKQKHNECTTATLTTKNTNRKKISLDKDTLSCIENEFYAITFGVGVSAQNFVSNVKASVTVRDMYLESVGASDYYITTAAEDDDNLSNAFRQMNVASFSPEYVRKRNYGQFRSSLQLLQMSSRRSYNTNHVDGEVMFKTWNDALAALSTVFILPEKVANGVDDDDDNEDVENRAEGIIQTLRGSMPDAQKKKKPTTAVQEYMEKITKKARESGILRPHERWKQVKVSSSAKPPSTFLSFDKRISEAEKIAEERKSVQEEKLAKEAEELDAKRKAEEQAEIFKNALRPLTEKEQHIVQTAIFGYGPPNEILATSDTDTVQRESMWRLKPGQWLNDEVIHYFLLCLSRRDQQMCQKDSSRKRSHFFKSFFVSKLMDEASGYRYQNVKRWSKKVAGKDVFALDKIIFPVNVGGVHWTCAVAFMQEKRIQFYDSMGGGGQRYVNGLLRYFEDEHKDKKKKPLDTSEWNLVTCEPDTPQQLNGFDCGVFTCMFADFLSRDMPLIFSQEHVTECRERIALSIMNGSALF